MKILLTILFTSFAFGQVAAVNSGTAVYPSSGTIAVRTDIPCTDSPIAGAWAPTGSTSNKTYCLGVGTYTLAAAIAFSGSKITVIGSGPATTIQRTTSGNNALTVTGDDFTLANLSLSGNNVNTGYLVNANANRFTMRDVQLINLGTNAGNGQVRVVSGSGHLVDHLQVLSTVAEPNLIFASDTADISGFKVTNSAFAMNGQPAGGAFVLDETASHVVYDFEIANNTFVGLGRCMYVHGPERGSINGFDCQLSADSALELFGLWGAQYVTFQGITLADNNHGLTNQPAITYHDCVYCTLKNVAVKLQNVGSQCLQGLDTHDSLIDGMTCGGGGGDLNNTSGRGMFEFGIGAPGSSDSNNHVSNVHITMPSGATQSCFRFAIGAAAGDTQNDLIFANNSCVGTASATALTLSTANGAVFANPFIYGNTFDTFSTGISIGSGITSAKIGSNTFATTTTRFSDSGTSTILEPIQVAETTTTSRTTAITTATLFTPDANAQYRVGGSVNCDSTSAAATVNITIGWTDPGNQAQTQTLSSAAACTALGGSSFGQLLFPFRAKSGTNITYATSIVNTPTYDVSVHLEQVTTK